MSILVKCGIVVILLKEQCRFTNFALIKNVLPLQKKLATTLIKLHLIGEARERVKSSTDIKQVTNSSGPKG